MEDQAMQAIVNEQALTEKLLMANPSLRVLHGRINEVQAIIDNEQKTLETLNTQFEQVKEQMIEIQKQAKEVTDRMNGARQAQHAFKVAFNDISALIPQLSEQKVQDAIAAAPEVEPQPAPQPAPQPTPETLTAPVEATTEGVVNADGVVIEESVIETQVPENDVPEKVNALEFLKNKEDKPKAKRRKLEDQA